VDYLGLSDLKMQRDREAQQQQQQQQQQEKEQHRQALLELENRISISNNIIADVDIALGGESDNIEIMSNPLLAGIDHHHHHHLQQQQQQQQQHHHHQQQQQQQQDGKTAASLGSQFSSFFLRPSLARGASSNNSSNSNPTTSSSRSRSSFKFNHAKSIDNDESIIELQRVSLSLADFNEVSDRISIAPRSNTSSESSIHNPMETLK